MAKNLFQSIFILILANLIVKPLWIFGIDLKTQNVVGASSYGIYFIVFNFSFLFHILLDFGINQFHNKEVAQKPELLKHRFGNLILLKAIFSVVYLFISFLLAWLIGFNTLQFKMLLFLALNQILLSFILFSRANFTAMQWYSWDAFFSVFDRILSIGICLVLLYTPFVQQFNIMYFIYAQTFALLLSAVLSLSVVFYKGSIVKPSFSFQQFKPLVLQAMPYAVVILLMTIYTRIDAVMIDKLLPETGAVQAGIYAAGYRLLDAVNMIPYLLASLLIPYFAKQISNKNSFSETLWDSFKIMLAICIPFVLVVFFFHKEILKLLYYESGETWYLSFQLLLYAFPFIFITYIFGGFLTAAGKLKQISYYALFTIVLNIVLNVFLIKKYEASGAALATIISQAVMALAQMIYVIRHFNTQFELKKLGSSLLYLLLNIGVMLLLATINIKWNVKMLTFVIIAILLSFVLQLVKIKNISTLQ